MKTADYCWALAIALTIGLLLWHDFARGGGTLPQVSLGPLRLSAFSLLAALDVLFGIFLVKRWCERFELDWETLSGGLPWIILIGYLLSHLVSIALYSPARLLDPPALIDPRTGISSFGGIYGGALVTAVFLRRKGLPFWRYADPLALGFVGGYIFGRAGCFAIHDHPGQESGFALAVRIDGVRRHDLGFYEMWLVLALTLAVLLISRRRRPPDGWVVAFLATFYAPIRFLFDSLRVADPRFAGLTPGQWMAIPLFAIAAWGWARLARRPDRPPPTAGPCPSTGNSHQP